MWPVAKERKKTKLIQMRLNPVLREQLEKLVELNATNITTEVTIAIRDRLKEAGLWPPPKPQPQEEQGDG